LPDADGGTATGEVQRDARGFLWFLRAVAVLAVPLFGGAYAISDAAAGAVTGAVAALAVVGLVLARWVRPGGGQFALVGVLTALEAVLFAVALLA
jgi:hypothetical protein